MREASALIDDVLEHDVQFDQDGQVRGIMQRAAGDRRISATDPDMRHGRKSASVLIAGFKAQIVASVVFAFIVFTKFIRANEHDGAALPELRRRLGHIGLRPSWWGGDHAYGTLANHHHFQERPAELVARMARPTNGGRFTKDEFELDFGTKSLTCPAGHTASMRWVRSRGKKGWGFEFDGQICAGCPLRSKCVSPRAAETKGRGVFVMPEDEKLIRAHLKRRTEAEFRARLARRSAVERAIAGYAQCSGKQARRFGIGRAEFDGQLSALAYNLRRIGSIARNNLNVAARLERACLRPRSAESKAGATTTARAFIMALALAAMAFAARRCGPRPTTHASHA